MAAGPDAFDPAPVLGLLTEARLRARNLRKLDHRLRSRPFRRVLALRVPDLRSPETEPTKAPTVAEIAALWLTSRIGVASATWTRNDVEVKRIVPLLGGRPIDAVDAHEVAAFVVTLSDNCKPATIRKTLQTLAMVFDHAGMTPNRPATRRS